MRYDLRRAVETWSLYEVLLRKKDRPCSDAYADADTQILKRVFAALRMLRAAGAPADRTKGTPDIQVVGTCTLDDGQQRYEIDVWVLKAKPTGWRLYFWVSGDHEIEFLYSVHKKRDARDPRDLKRCCTILGEIVAGRAKSVELDIPPR